LRHRPEPSRRPPPARRATKAANDADKSRKFVNYASSIRARLGWLNYVDRGDSFQGTYGRATEHLIAFGRRMSPLHRAPRADHRTGRLTLVTNPSLSKA
jgi:hypothetical protein